MRTPRQTAVRRALLQALDAIPERFLQRDETLRADAARLVLPPPLVSEIDAELQAAQEARLIQGQPDEDTIRWKITIVGRAWLAEHP